MDGVNVGIVIGVCFSYPDSEALEPYLDGIRNSVSMEGSTPCVLTFDAVFDDGIDKHFTPAGDSISMCIEVIAFRVSL